MEENQAAQAGAIAGQAQTPAAPTTGETKTGDEGKDPAVLAANYKSAMTEERQNRKAAEAKLAEFEAKLAEYTKKEAEDAQKELVRKGKHEEVIAEQKARLEELSKKAEAYDKFLQAQTEKQEVELAELVKQIPDEVQKRYEVTLGKLSLEDKISFLNNLKADVVKPDYKQTPNTAGVTASKPAPDANMSFTDYMTQVLQPK